MPIEQFILVAMTLFVFVSVLYIPKAKYRLALVGIITFQATTWAAIIMLVQMGQVTFPFREFTKATQVGFIQNFFFYPMIFVWFMILYPKNSPFIRKILHYFIFISIVVWVIYFVSVYTTLEDFIKCIGFSQLLRLYSNMLFQFFISRLYMKWFSGKTNNLIEV